MPLRAHICIRAVAAAWTRYRQEWSYDLHCIAELGAISEPIAPSRGPTHEKETVDHCLRKALSQLSVEDQQLIHRLFWDRASEGRVAATLQISQQCVSKRKARVLRLLYGTLISQFHLVSNFLTVYWASLDSLDLLPVVDFGIKPSSVRYKEAVKPMDTASEVILALRPVTFRYKKELDPKGAPQFGLVAEEVAKVNPDLVVLDDQGKPFTVRYEEVNAMLLNEFIKARRQIDSQQKQIDALTAGLRRVSAQFELSKSAPQTVLNSFSDFSIDL